MGKQILQKMNMRMLIRKSKPGAFDFKLKHDAVVYRMRESFDSSRRFSKIMSSRYYTPRQHQEVP